MRLKISRSVNAASFYVIQSVYVNGKEKTVTVEKLGTEKYIEETHKVIDAEKWAREYVAELNKKEKEGILPNVIQEFNPQKQISKHKQVSYNCGYLFLQDLYHKLGLDKMCKDISKKYSFSSLKAFYIWTFKEVYRTA